MRVKDVRFRFDFVCDADDCARELVFEDCFGTQAQANRAARSEGWTIGKRDLCPDHRRKP